MSFLLMDAFLELLFRDSEQLPHRILLDFLIFKFCSFQVRFDFCSGKCYKEVISGEYGGCGTWGILFLAKICCTNHRTDGTLVACRNSHTLYTFLPSIAINNSNEGECYNFVFICNRVQGQSVSSCLPLHTLTLLL